MSLPNEAAGAMPDENQGLGLADAEVVDALREEIHNGKPVEWLRLIPFENLTPLQAAIAARGMDPFRWPDGTLNAQGETLPGFREQIARLEQWLGGRRTEWSLEHLVEALGDRAPIGMREAVQSAIRSAQAKEREQQEREAARRKAGFFTLEEAADALSEQLEMHSGARGSLLERMREAVRDSSLIVRDPHTNLPYRPEIVRDFYELVTPVDVNAWLERCGVAYRWDLGRPDSLPVAEPAARKDHGEAQDEMGIPAGPRAAQIAFILEVLPSLGVKDVMDIPVGKKREAQRACIEADPHLFTPSGFEHAWKAASRDGQLRIHGKERYIKRRP